jgi:hypothetical protein
LTYSHDLALVRAHFRTLKPWRDLLIDGIVRRVAAARPHTSPITLRRLAEGLTRGLRPAVYGTEDYALWSEALINLGRAHAPAHTATPDTAAGLDARLAFARLVREALLASLREIDRVGMDRDDARVARAWERTLDAALGHIARGLAVRFAVETPHVTRRAA